MKQTIPLEGAQLGIYQTLIAQMNAAAGQVQAFIDMGNPAISLYEFDLGLPGYRLKAQPEEPPKKARRRK